MPLGHAPHRFTRAEETASDVGGENSVQASGVHLFQSSLAIENASIVNQRGNRSKRFVDRFEQSHHLRFHRDIGGYGNSSSASAFNCCDNSIGRRSVMAIVDTYSIAALAS
jgi:hypothetical protein